MKNVWVLLVAVAFVAGCATPEAPKPPPEPKPVPAPPPPPKPEPKPEPKPQPVAEKVTFAADVLFDFDKAVIRPEGKSKLDDLSTKVRGINLEVAIAIGHADSIGSDAYNQKLSVRRAEAVKAYLVSRGTEPNRVYTEGKGEKQPVTGERCRKMGAESRSNKKLVDCLQPNRRVEIEVIGTRKN
jgi:OmpA-OmpF porin, OOP family